jgi:hypothetical protein
MIDTRTEALLSLAQAAKSLPMIDGKVTNISTIFRWTRKGIRGVKLEHVYVGRRICTSEAALNRFFNAIAEAPAPTRTRHAAREKEKPRSQSQREAAFAKAKARLQANGIKVDVA